VSIDQEHGTQQTSPPPFPNVEFSRSEKEWQQLIQWDSLVVMATLLNEMLLPIAATEAVKQEKQNKKP
jgi:hypothetical protein